MVEVHVAPEGILTGYIQSFLALMVASLLIVYKWRGQRRHEQEFFKRLGISYVEPSLVSGNIKELRRNKERIEALVVSEWIKKYGNLFGFFVGPKPFLVVSDLDIIKAILIKDFSNFPNRPSLPIKFEPLVDSLIGLRDKRWKDIRKLLAPCFTASKLRLMLEVFNKKVNQMIKISGNKIEKDGTIELYSTFQGLTLDVISECVLAMSTNCQELLDQDPFFKAVHQYMKNALSPAIHWARYFPFFARMLSFFSRRYGFSGRMNEMIVCNLKEVIAYRRQHCHDRTIDMLQLMLDAADVVDEKNDGRTNKRTLTDKEIIANCWVLLLAGYETTSAALTYTCYLLAKHPDVQDRLYDEISSKLQNGIENVTYEDLINLRYLDQVLNESMRLFPPGVSFVTREAAQDIVVKNTFIPKGTFIYIPVWNLHYNPEYWPDPCKFDPDRFSASSEIKRNPMTFLPFGDGPRVCIGMRFAQLQSKMTLVGLLSRYRLEACDETPAVLKLEMPTVSLNPSENVFVKAIKRDITTIQE